VQGGGTAVVLLADFQSAATVDQLLHISRERAGVDTCTHLISDIARSQGGRAGATRAARRAVTRLEATACLDRAPGLELETMSDKYLSISGVWV
jgi:hypothetical protein